MVALLTVMLREVMTRQGIAIRPLTPAAVSKNQTGYQPSRAASGCC
jgi:hypothetical protein